ncbi:MAG: hypothetical protein GC139_03775 [Sideroxydans sp.]|nr:hypothetical protein [Sideroxydans sp.]
MFKLPQSIIYAMLAVNISAFAIVLQLDMLVIRSLTAKIIVWTLTIGAWALVYKKRKKYFYLF